MHLFFNRHRMALKIVLSILGTFSLISLIALEMLDFSVQRRKTQLIQEASKALELVTGQLIADLDEVQMDILAISEMHEVKGFDTAFRADLEGTLLAFSRFKHRYDQIRLLNLQGQEELRIDQKDGQPVVVEPGFLQKKGNRYYFKQSLNLGPEEVFVSPLDLNIENGQIEQPFKPMIRLISAWYGTQGQRRGVLVLNYRAQGLLSMAAQHERRSQFKIMLLNDQGFYLKGRRPSEEWGFMIPNRSHENFTAHFPKTWVQMQQSHQGNFTEDGDLLVYKDLFEIAPSRLNPISKFRAVAWVPQARFQAMNAPEAWWALSLAVLGFSLLAILEIWLIRHQEHRRMAESQLHDLRQDLVSAQEMEQRRISYELHDSLAPLLSAINIQVLMLNRKLKIREEPQLEVTEMLQESIAHVRKLAYELAPPDLEMQDFQSIICELCEDFKGQYGTPVELEFSLDIELEPWRATHLYRMVQEALRNIAKHAQARRVEVRLLHESQHLILEIKDDGVGFESGRFTSRPERGMRLGIKGMLGRASMIGGTCKVISQVGKGTHIQVKVPVSDE